MANMIELSKNWVSDGKELKPKTGASSSNTWIFDGREIKPKTGASSSNTWLWDGKEIKPKTSASSSNTWVVEGGKVKPKTSANSSNTYETKGQPSSGDCRPACPEALVILAVPSSLDPLQDWYCRMQDSTDYLIIEQMKAGMAYAIWARNAYVGIWLPDEQGFLISRYKLAPVPFLFVEHHWDTGEPFGTAKPLHPLEMCPLSVPMESEYQDEQQCAELCNWLDDLETRYPPVPGCESVNLRRQAAGKWERRQAMQRLLRHNGTVSEMSR